MSGTPTEAEIQAQWKASTKLLEYTRVYSDSIVLGAGGLMDVLMQSLEGDFTPSALAAAGAGYRATLSSMADQGRTLQFLQPILFEYGNLINVGGGYTDLGSLSRALYEWFVTNSLTVQSRNITFDTTATAGGSNVGNGVCKRLTVDENAFALEACTIEQKRLRCRQDANSGVKQHAEVFEIVGEAASQDALLRGLFGSGTGTRFFLASLHAGSGPGGSMLRNSSFDSYSSGSTPKFAGWNLTAGIAADIEQNTASTYRGNPSSSTAGSLRINGGTSATITLKQPLTNMAGGRLDPETPYFLRVMLNKTVGTAVGGTVNLRIGSVTVSVTIAAMSANWGELQIPAGVGCWFRNFDEATVDVEIEWASSTSGYLLVDDVILAPWTLIDGTYWVVTHNAATPTAWLVDDTLDFTDTGGAPGTGVMQWWYGVAGLGYLPSTTGTPTMTDP